MRSAGWCAYMQSQLEKEERRSDEKCPLCGGTMYIRDGKYGQFLGCEDYPKCKGTRKIK